MSSEDVVDAAKVEAEQIKSVNFLIDNLCSYAFASLRKSIDFCLEQYL